MSTGMTAGGERTGTHVDWPPQDDHASGGVQGGPGQPPPRPRRRPRAGTWFLAVLALLVLAVAGYGVYWIVHATQSPPPTTSSGLSPQVQVAREQLVAAGADCPPEAIVDGGFSCAPGTSGLGVVTVLPTPPEPGAPVGGRGVCDVGETAREVWDGPDWKKKQPRGLVLTDGTGWYAYRTKVTGTTETNVATKRLAAVLGGRSLPRDVFCRTQGVVFGAGGG
jgi:hypothetical protein